MERDHSTETEVKARIALQEQTSKNENLSDFIINNDNLANLELICKDIHYKLTK
jgi:dephospho-CoA kinase